VAAEGMLAEGLATLVENDRWKQAGEAGYRFVEKVFSVDRAMNAHLDLYHKLLGMKKSKR
jgi:glycosyltransferase involved in cell wall biosynthesis